MSAGKSKKPRLTQIRSKLFDDKCILTVGKLWRKEGEEDSASLSKQLSEFDVELIEAPFPVCIVRNLAPLKKLRAAVKEVENELLSRHFAEKSNDLYQFRQTGDVSCFSNFRAISGLYNLICTDLFEWVEKTLVPSGLKPDVAATFSLYGIGDRLLCHDDKCEDRHIAFVLYLTEGWNEELGGNLELLEADSQGNPVLTDKGVVSIPAIFNSLVLFEVTPTSYHQVTEVLTSQSARLSLNGWFHKSGLPTWPEGPPLPFLTYPPSSSTFELNETMFIKYLCPKNQRQIKALFVANSEIQLDEFLCQETYSAVLDEFSSLEISWEMTGPANIRHYEVADQSTLPSALSYLWTLLQSRSWLKFLGKITNLDLIPHPESDLEAWQQGKQPECRVEIQRWKHGSYTLVHDKDSEFHTCALDVIIRIPMEGTSPPEDGNDLEGGHVVYIDKQSQDENCLLHLGAKMNSLALVFREPDTLRFTKYLDQSSNPFYQIQCLYIPWMPPPDKPDLRHVDSDADSEPLLSDDEEFEGYVENDDFELDEEGDSDVENNAVNDAGPSNSKR